MCLLILLSGLDPEFPILIASNRDEDRSRRAAPPGLFVGEQQRILSPRDRLAGGTWMGVNDLGMFAGLTNLAGSKDHPDAASRGLIPHLALDNEDLEAAIAAVTNAVSVERHNGFQLLLSDGRESLVLVHRDGTVERTMVEGSSAVISNEHRLGELVIPGLSAALASGLSAEERLESMQALLLDTGELSGYPILKQGEVYGTVSSSLIGVRPSEPRQMIWKYAPGSPDVTGYRSYGNLGRRLIEE